MFTKALDVYKRQIISRTIRLFLRKAFFLAAFALCRFLLSFSVSICPVVFPVILLPVIAAVVRDALLPVFLPADCRCV